MCLDYTLENVENPQNLLVHLRALHAVQMEQGSEHQDHNPPCKSRSGFVKELKRGRPPDP